MPQRCPMCLHPAPPFDGGGRYECPRCGVSVVLARKEEQPTPFDPSFGPAVSAGLLSAWEASQRGSRASYAARLARRHGLPLERAFDVADNVVPLAKALGMDALRGGRVHLPLAVAILTSVAAFASIEVWRAVREIGKEPPVAPFRAKDSIPAGPVNYTISTEIHRDPDGGLTRIVAGDPGEVLQAFCREQQEQNLVAVETRPSKRGVTGTYRQQGRAYSIDILRDELTDRWYAGSGLESLAGRPASAPEAPEPVAAEPAPVGADAVPCADEGVAPAEATEPVALETDPAEEAAPPTEGGEGG